LRLQQQGASTVAGSSKVFCSGVGKIEFLTDVRGTIAAHTIAVPSIRDIKDAAVECHHAPTYL
jgi:hypothetical protein